MQTTLNQFEILLEDIQLKEANEEAKFREISKWLKADFDESDLGEKKEMFAKLFSKVDLTKLSPQCLTEFRIFVRGYSKLFQAGRLCVVTFADNSGGLMFADHRKGSVSYEHFPASKRQHYAVVSRNESIFIFGGCYEAEGFNFGRGAKRVAAACEKLDTTTNA
ncbi:hypothetical protein TSMEX_007068 [Taenia solium]|eukprot:TsM_001129300 transcript=TsM_001129300 gene=TsM_001129300